MIDANELLKLAKERDPIFTVDLPGGHTLTFRHYKTAAAERSLLRKADEWARQYYKGKTPLIPKEWKAVFEGTEEEDQLFVLRMAYVMEKQSEDGIDASTFVQLSANSLVWQTIVSAFDAYQSRGIAEAFVEQVDETKND